MSIFERTELVLGADALEKLKNARVAVFGVGGVGGYVVEALARCGAGALDIFDGDTVAESNINRRALQDRRYESAYKRYKPGLRRYSAPRFLHAR